MAFSADAIGFYLQMEDQLSPVLAGAASNYDKFVGSMEKSNKKVFSSSSGALGKVAELAKAIGDIPQGVGASYREVLKKMKGQAKAFTQPINLAFGSKDKQALSKSIAQAVHKAMSGASIRLGATFPSSKLGYFDNSVGLRALYKQIPQPPDMRGSFQPKKFATGGIVEGPQKGFDSVLSLLQPGEIVLPKDVSDSLLALAKEAGTAGPPNAMGKSIADIQNLANGLAKLKGAIDAGLGKPEDIQAYRRGVQGLSSNIDDLTAMASSLSYSTRVALAGSITEVTKRMEDFKEEGEDTMPVYKKLLQQIVGPARFMAISKAVDELSDTMSKLQSGTSQAFSDLEGGQTESFVTNMNQMNRILGMSRSELRAFKIEAGGLASTADLNVNEMSEALEGMAEAGLRNKKVMLELAPAVTQMAAGSTANVNALAASAYEMTDAFGFSAGRIGVVFDNIRQFSSVTASSADDAVNGMKARFQRLGPVLSKVTEDQGTQLLTSIQALGAATADNWAGSVDTIPDLLADVLSRSEDGLNKAALVFGSTADEIERKLASGDIGSILNNVGQQVQMLTAQGNLQGLQALQEAMGFEGSLEEFSKLGTNMDSINDKLTELGQMASAPNEVVKAMDNLNEASLSNRTAFEEFQTEVGQLTAKELPGLGFSVAEVIDGIKEFGPTSLIAIAMLGKMGFGAAMAGGKLLGLTGIFGKLGGVLSMGKKGKGAAGMLSGIGDAAGGATKAVGGGAFFASLSAGLTTLAGGIGTLGAVLMSPPGIAFTVTFVAVLFSIAGATRVAMPALKELAGVAKVAIGGLVEAFGSAVPAIQTFIETAGDVLMTGLSNAREFFTDMAGMDGAKLASSGAGMIAMAGGLATLGLAVGEFALALGGLTISETLRSFLGSTSVEGGIAGAISAVVGDMNTMSVGPQMITNAKLMVVEAINFLGAYGQLLRSVDNLPTSSFFGDSFAEKLKSESRSIAMAVKAMQVDFNGKANLRQKSQQASYSPEQIQTVIDAVVQAGLNDEVRSEMQENNRLLRQILEAMLAGRPAPATPQAASRATGASPLTRDLGGFNV